MPKSINPIKKHKVKQLRRAMRELNIPIETKKGKRLYRRAKEAK